MQNAKTCLAVVNGFSGVKLSDACYKHLVARCVYGLATGNVLLLTGDDDRRTVVRIRERADMLSPA